MRMLKTFARVSEGEREVTMRRSMRLGTSFGLAVALAGAISCGGRVVGVGNGGNRIFEAGGIAEALAEELAEDAATPEITDELLAEIFQSTVTHARAGDPEAALIVFRVAAEQREDEES